MPLIQLDENDLAAIVGGFGISWGDILTRLIDPLFPCLRDAIDDAISAAQEGYSDASGS
jgi:hypothetical protein